MFTRLRSWAARRIAPRLPGTRAFAGAQIGRMFSDWIASATSADAEIRGSYRRLIDRSRSLERDNDYQRGFLLSCQRNINGSHRFDLRCDAGQLVMRKGKVQWQPDVEAKALIEEAWREWGKKGSCTVCRKFSWRDVRRLAVRSVVRDGNVIIRKVRGAAAGNRFGFALQLWEIDHLDLEKFQSRTREGGEIRFGIELDALGGPIAYWLRARHPGDECGSGTSVRFTAAEVYHLFLPDRAEQSIGYPWIVSAITRLRQLGAFEEAAVIAARLGASKAGFFKTKGTSSWTGDTDGNGRAVMAAEPGQFEELPEGWELENWDPAYPNIETGDFRKAMLRGVCSSLGVSYTTLGNDLESVNFSSARVGLFDEREGWKDLQLFFTEGLWEPIYADWLESALTLSALGKLPLAKYAQFNRPVFKARRWPAIDPLKEVEAAAREIDLKLSSRREKIEERGGDVEEVFHDNLEDQTLAAELGLSLATAETADVTTTLIDEETGAKTVTTKKPAAQVQSATALDAAKTEQEILRQKLETYGTAVRAGVISPNLEDERAMREALDLPKPSPAVVEAWTEDGGVRKPITLQGQKENAAQADALAATAEGKPSPAATTQ